jgi:anti-anti-sigma factor
VTIGELRLQTRDGIVYATVAGDIDMSNVQQIRDAVGRATTNQALGLVLDLTAVDYLDSAGIHLIHMLGSHLQSHGQKLALVIPPDSVINDALRLAGLSWEESRVATAEEATRLFGGAALPSPTQEESG